MVPSREQLKEVWFTYSLVSNFLCNPALVTPSEVRLANAERWLRAVQQADPRDAVMAATLYFLEWRLGQRPAAELEDLRRDAADKLELSAYWRQRDEAFGFSLLLDRQVPPLDQRCTAFLGAGSKSGAEQ